MFNNSNNTFLKEDRLQGGLKRKAVHRKVMHSHGKATVLLLWP